MKVLAVIPARGGSKGIPRKNLQALGGKPLVGHTIAAARGADRLTTVVVSTDDGEIARVAAELGADVPFSRPVELATDSARAIPVLQHALREMELRNGIEYDAIMMLQPTSPFRTAQDIDGAVSLLEQSNADSVISVVDVGGHHPARMKYLEDGRLVDPSFCEEYENQPRQELRTMYLRNGAIYLVRRDTLLAGSLKGTDCRAWVMPAERSANIDTELDLRWCQWLLSQGMVCAS